MSQDNKPIELTLKEAEDMRAKGIGEVTETYVAGLAMLGVSTMCIGISVDDKPGGVGYYKSFGHPVLTINLLCGLLSQLQPAHFRLLLTAMQSDPFFAVARGDARDSKPGTVN